jgi:hypothetical protein
MSHHHLTEGRFWPQDLIEQYATPKSSVKESLEMEALKAVSVRHGIPLKTAGAQKLKSFHVSVSQFASVPRCTVSSGTATASGKTAASEYGTAGDLLGRRSPQ